MTTSAEYRYEVDDLTVTEEMRRDFRQFGYIMVRNFFDSDDLRQVKQVIEDNDEIVKRAFGVSDGAGRESKMCLWNHPGNDVTGMVSRCEKTVNTCEGLLGGEVYHYHTKLMMKNPRTGGSHLWHQDYGYWYKNGCLFPDMMTVFIAIDKCVKENGCLQILRGSHKCGRINHVMVAGQTGADVERVEAIQNSGQCPLEKVEMEPGDALFFHCNLLHTSTGNDSDLRRWAFLCSYNKASNDPVIKHHHPQYTRIKKVSNSAIRECTNFTDMTGKDFMDPTKDATIRVEKSTNNQQIK
ncbi:probable phytanoyl-CoA dioxygenase isoform X2 [Mizuhopecten yessoensis]|nr:probable phytanoyl-CoA dioxygenase isoform X2 [Mizuhopecten yessoensis]XP_021362350.1 probable phytanoyl-CoA dioxygenase isoform X2 [Mizuhopecten yessoensis]